MRPSKVKIGDVFDRLTVEEQAPSEGGSRQWWCRCKCGNRHKVAAYLLGKGVGSCGCKAKENGKATRFQKTHGESAKALTLTYRRWVGMIRRTNNHEAYAGVSVCERWRQSYEAFKADMGECPGPTYTIDRKENAKGYEPDNCRWATARQQANNRSNNLVVTLADGRRLTIGELVTAAGVPFSKRSTVYRRIARGQTPEQAIQGIT